jgi:hypothetical protein
VTEGGPDHFALASHKMRESESDRSVHCGVSRSDEPTNPGMYACMYASRSVSVCVRLGVRVVVRTFISTVSQVVCVLSRVEICDKRSVRSQQSVKRWPFLQNDQRVA